ncbi:MAG: hypothetical protein H0A75_00165 [Candidatus Methanofishera endochildressiae]|uniref:Uncharacterized protein n=1 Tax=Candidatus Methanofishera endochildressiae TaxID=2738884 RepID=A0A7Z0SD66_9GAMM|nr:hypothetical protein [Candidatus Methanofishera endochildressiae]
MIYELKTPVQVMDTELGSYVEASEVSVIFTGRKGLKAIKRLQDIIFISARSMSNDRSVSDTAKDDRASGDITSETMMNMLSLTGKSEVILDGILEALILFSKVGGQKMNNTLIDDLDIEDIDGLCEAVMLHFLLPGVIRKLNSLSR